jgi:hypothetical protein
MRVFEFIARKVALIFKKKERIQKQPKGQRGMFLTVQQKRGERNATDSPVAQLVRALH